MRAALASRWYDPAVGWLRRLHSAEDEFSLREPHFDRDAAAWQAWATQHGWRYQAEAPELVGRYEPAFTRGAEGYSHLLTSQLHGLAVTAFERRTHAHDWRSDTPEHSLRSFVVVRLPGAPPDEFVKMGPEKALRQLGGNVPSGYDLRLERDDLVAHRPGKLHPDRLHETAELLTLQIASAPATFWRDRGS